MATQTQQHTPGPWQYRQLIPDGTIIKKEGTFDVFKPASESGPEYDVCADVLVGGPIRKEQDAALIAAAPETAAERDRLLTINADLLTAMRELAQLTGWRLPVEAIAKAEGA